MLVSLALATMLIAGGNDDPPCGDAMKIMQELHEKYHENPIVVAQMGKQQFLLTTSDDHKAWTAMVTDGKTACLLGAGDDLKLTGEGL